MDKITLSKMDFEGQTGCFDFEKKDGQKFIVETFNGAYWDRDTYDLSGLTCNAS